MTKTNFTSDEKPIFFNPPLFDFGIVPVSDHPLSFSSKITNITNNLIVLKFDSISTDSLWFTGSNKITNEQRKSGFNIFNYSKPISDFILMPNESKNVFCTIVPSKINRYTLPLKIPLPVHVFQKKEKDESINDNESKQLFVSETSIIEGGSYISILNYEKEITVSVSVTAPHFKVSPKILFLDDCIVNSSQTAKFSIKNKSKFPISIIIYPPPFIEIITPKYPNYIKINSCETVTLSLTHTPQKVGQFDHKIAFDCIESTNSPKILHLMTSVSPVEIPPNFPTIKFKSKNSILDFGEIHSGQHVEDSFVISNDSDTTYDVLIAGIIDIFSPIISENDNVQLNNSFSSINTMNSSVDFSYVAQSENALSASSTANISGSAPSASLANPHSTIAGSVANTENSFLSYVLKEQLKIGSSKELQFKTLLSSQFDSKLKITLHPHSSMPIFVGYQPVFNLSVNSDVFDRRKFMITLVFNGTKTYYRHIKCRAVVCNSQIKIEPSVIHLGDVVAGTLSQTGVVQISNISPLKTTVKIQSSVKALITTPNQIDISPKSTINYAFSFYPKKVNPEFSGTITFSNINNSNNEVRLTVEAAVIATASESQHSMSYSIHSGSRHLTYLDFNFVPQNFISARTFILKNKLKTPLVIKFTSSSPDELFLYYDEKYDMKLKRTSSSSSISNNNTDQSASAANEKQTIDINDTNQTNSLLTPDSPLRSIYELAEYTKKYQSFYENQYVLAGIKYTDKQIVEHFETLLNQFEENITKRSLQNVEGSEIELPPSSRMELCAVLIPKGDKSYIWKRKQIEFSIELDPKITNVPRSFSIVYNTCESSSFLSSQNLNFGTIQVNTHSQYSLYLANESSIPLLFKLMLDTKIPITFDQNKNYGIVSPFSSLVIPFSIAPKIDGKLLSSIVVRNILNINEERRIQLKGRVVRRSHFFIDPQEIDFGDVTAGTSSPKFLIFVTNTSSSENEFTFSNVPKEIYGNNVQPIISYQFKDIKTRLLTEKVKLQIEKLGCKLRCLQRKKKWEYAEQIQKVIDELSNTEIESTSLQIKQLGEKFMDSLIYKAEPLQLHCIEVQMIPIIISKKPLKEPENIEGVIMIYESGRVDSQKTVKYKARVVPQKKIQMSDVDIDTGLLIEPSSITVDHVYIQETKRIELTIKNIEKNEENFWILSNSSDNAIITSQTNEGKLQPNESIKIPIDIYCSDSGVITKTITVASQNCWKEIPITINASYRPILQLSTTKIDFGQIQLTSLQSIVKRTSMTITNISDIVLFVVVSHNVSFLSIYENDPEEPQFKPLRLDINSSITINILFKPQLEIEMYRKYKTLVVDSFIDVKAYDIKEEAENSLNDSHSVITAPYFKVSVPVLGRIGRIGLRPSQKIIDFGSLNNQESVEGKMSIKNRSSKLNVDVVTSPTQGIIVEPSNFSLKGHQELELTVKFRPSSWGVNEGFIYFSTSMQQQLQNGYQKKVIITSFVDPKIIEVDTDNEHKNITKIALGKIYLQADGTPVPKSVSMYIRNVSRHPTTILIPKIEKKYMIRAKEETSIGFQFPFKTMNLLDMNEINDAKNSEKNDRSNKKDPSKIFSSSSVITAAKTALQIAETLVESNSDEVVEEEEENLEHNISLKDNTKLSTSKTNINTNSNSNLQSVLLKPEQSIFSYNLLFISAATKKLVKIIKIEGEFVVSVGSLAMDTISLGRFGSFNNWTVESTSSNSIIIHNHSNIDLYMNSTILTHSNDFNSIPTSQSSTTCCLKIPNQIGPIPPNSDYQVKVEPIIEMMKNVHIEGPQSNLILFTNTNNHDNKLKLTVNYDVRDFFIQVDRAKRGSNKNEFIVSLHKFTEIVVNQKDVNEKELNDIINVNNKESSNESIATEDENDNEIVTTYVASCWFSITNLLDREVTIEVNPKIEKSVSKYVKVDLFQRKTNLMLSSFEILPNEPFEISVKATKLKRKWNSENGIVFAKLNFKAENSSFIVSVVYQ